MRKQILIAALVVLTAAAGSISAATYMKQVACFDDFEMMGFSQEGMCDTSEVWMTDDAFYTEASEDIAVLVKVNPAEIIVISHAEKKCLAVSMDFKQMLIDFAATTGGQQEQIELGLKIAEGVLEAFMCTAKSEIVRTDDVKVIGEWDTRRYHGTFSMALMETEYDTWTVEDIKGPWDIYQVAMGEFFGEMIGRPDLFSEMMKVKGLPVLTTAIITFVDYEFGYRTELLEHYEANPPDGIFEIPEDYIWEDFPPDF